MLIFIHFSFCDLRHFTEFDNCLLQKPNWASPKPSQFVKGSGQIIERRNGGLDNWIGENFICKINKGIKFENISIRNRNIILKNISKHQYTSITGVLTKYVFVFKTVGQTEEEIDKNYIEQIIDHLLNSKIAIRTTDFKFKKTSLSKYKNDLREFHLTTTTKNNIPDLSKQSKFIRVCTPQIFFLLDSYEESKLRDKSIKNFTTKGKTPFSLFSFWSNNNNSPLRVWVHKKRTISSLLELNRDLRISLLRIHSEFECLNFVLSAINSDNIKIKSKTTQSDKLQYYINNSITSILKQKEKVKRNIGNESSIEYFKEIFFTFQPGDYDSLVMRVKEIQFRLQIERKAIIYINNLNQNFETMENKYKIENSQVGAVGDNAKSDNNNFQQINYVIPENLDYQKLLSELTKLKEELRKTAETPEQFEAVKNIAHAEEEAKNKNGNSIIALLKSGGKWVFDTATKIGVSIVSEILKKNMGL